MRICPLAQRFGHLVKASEALLNNLWYNMIFLTSLLSLSFARYFYLFYFIFHLCLSILISSHTAVCTQINVDVVLFSDVVIMN